MEKMKSEHPITEMADTLEVSASGYADHLHKDQRPRRMEDRRLQAELVPIFEQSRSTDGRPRLHWLPKSRLLIGPTRSGLQILPTSTPAKDGFTWPASSICARGGWLGGTCPTS